MVKLPYMTKLQRFSHLEILHVGTQLGERPRRRKPQLNQSLSDRVSVLRREARRFSPKQKKIKKRAVLQISRSYGKKNKLNRPAPLHR